MRAMDSFPHKQTYACRKFCIQFEEGPTSLSTELPRKSKGVQLRLLMSLFQRSFHSGVWRQSLLSSRCCILACCMLLHNIVHTQYLLNGLIIDKGRYLVWFQVVVIVPFCYDCYEPMVRMAGATPVFVPPEMCKSAPMIYVFKKFWKCQLLCCQ